MKLNKIITTCALSVIVSITGLGVVNAADSTEEADRLFNEISKGGTTIMPMEDTFWGAYFGMCVDPFGIQWMINFTADQNN